MWMSCLIRTQLHLELVLALNRWLICHSSWRCHCDVRFECPQRVASRGEEIRGIFGKEVVDALFGRTDCCVSI